MFWAGCLWLVVVVVVVVVRPAQEENTLPKVGK